ncbi:MAG: tripartite tricarboxylate transporter substrate binding protein [Betaproteobacteria bacterium]|nr:tripartite tricarboxylate transporter substrate binding protein [Betaproteobacteria bacterium]
MPKSQEEVSMKCSAWQSWSMSGRYPRNIFSPSFTCVAAWLLAAALAAAAGTPVRAASTKAAPDYPNKPIRIIATAAPGSGPDILSRLVGQKLTDAWGQQVVIDNRAGATGTIGAEIASRAAPDGYTLMMATSLHAIVHNVFPNLKYDLLKDFAPISLLGSVPFLLVVNPSVPAKSVSELIALAKAKPGELRFGSGGSGSPPHLCAEIFKTLTGINMVHVPYKSVTPAITEVMGGQVHLVFAVIPAVLPMVKSGRLRPLGVSSTKRTPLVPDVPTIAESVPGYEYIGWYGLVAPAGARREIISRLNGELVKALRTPEFREKLAGIGAEPLGTTPQEFGSFMREEVRKLAKAVKDSGTRID